MRFLVSVVLPCYNEKDNIYAIYGQLKEVLSRYSVAEILFVDDGSTDGTAEVLKDLAARDSKVKYLSFSRNFGHQIALKAGIDHTTGDCVITMDADLQHPPSLIPQLIETWQSGFDVVNTIRGNQKSLPVFKRISSALFYRLAGKLTSVDIGFASADYRLLDRKVVDAITQFNENFLFIRGLIPWLGFRQTSIPFTPNNRNAGETKYSFLKMARFALNGITSFSIKPLYISIGLGAVIAALAFVYGLYALYIYLFTNDALPGWTSITASVLFIGGIQLMVLGIIGIYLGKLFIENKRRPVYVVAEKNL